ncbi:MAG: TonB-dependent receptor plug domain-containing protein [bacterium]
MKLKKNASTLFVFILCYIFLLSCSHFSPILEAQEPEGSMMNFSSDYKVEEKEIKSIILPEVVITATRTQTLLKEVASSLSIITEEQIENAQINTVFEALQGIPGLDTVRSGGPGGNSTIKIRGTETGHTLVLIDGIEMNDPSLIDRHYNFSDLSTNNIERIEVLRGPQSTLYGSDAIGGVINIITKKGEGPPQISCSYEAGSFESHNEQALLNGGTELVNYSIGISRSYTDGISTTIKENGNAEEDAYENLSASARVGLTPTENFDIDLFLRHIDTEGETDTFGDLNNKNDDLNYLFDTEQSSFKIQPRISLFDDIWEQKMGFSFTKNRRHYFNDTDTDHPFDLMRNSYKSSLFKFNWQHDIRLHESSILTIGLLEYEEEKGKYNEFSDGLWGPYSSTLDEQVTRTIGFFVQDQLKFIDKSFTTIGMRVDEHNRFGSEVTYRITSAYLFDWIGTKLKGTYGTGFKAPSIYQLFSEYGNENLNPEKSHGFDLGIVQNFANNKLILDATFFYIKSEDMIKFVWNASNWMESEYINISRARSKGLEFMLSLKPMADFTLNANYTYTDCKDLSNDETLLQRARNRFKINFNYDFKEKVIANLDILYMGRRFDKDYSTNKRFILGDYTLVNISASYSFTEIFQVFGRVENLFDEKYEEIKGYSTPGISIFAGFRLLL